MKTKRSIAILTASFTLGITCIAIGVRTLVLVRQQDRMKRCQENLRRINGAKVQWALECNQKPGSTVTAEDLYDPNDCANNFFPIEPSGGSYILNPVGEFPECSTGLAGHDLESIGIDSAGD